MDGAGLSGSTAVVDTGIPVWKPSAAGRVWPKEASAFLTLLTVVVLLLHIARDPLWLTGGGRSVGISFL